jgi:hypothetical protein
MGKRLKIPGTNYSDVIRVRAHHLLCLQGFQGYGYSRGFKRNLKEIIQYLKSHPHGKLKVVANADIICQKCPHLKGKNCNKSSDSNSIERMDFLVLEKLDIEEGREELAQNLFSRVNKTFKNQRDLEDVCGNCSWKNKCLWYLSRISGKG